MSANILQGDCIEVLKGVGDRTVQTCVTSPPYYGLRDYSTASWEGGDEGCDHIDANKLAERMRQKKSMIAVGERTDGSTRTRAHDVSIGKEWQYRDTCPKCGAVRVDKQIGLEETPEQYIANLVAVFREVRRVLKDDGTLWLNLGDSYWGGKGQSAQAWSTEHQDRDTMEKAQHQITGMGETRPTDGKHDIYKPKDLLMIPARVALALQADGWWLRSEIVWHKPNPMPESVTDRPTKSHEMIYLLAKSAKYYYDAEAVKEDGVQYEIERRTKEHKKGLDTVYEIASDGKTGLGNQSLTGAVRNVKRRQEIVMTGKRNRRDVWTVTTKPYKGAHFATFPPDLIEPCILAGTSAKGECPQCGKAWVRVVEQEKTATRPGKKSKYGERDEQWRCSPSSDFHERKITTSTTVGWRPQCECRDTPDAKGKMRYLDPVPQTVLDPFNGSGTTAAVAIKHGRNAIGIELNPDYIELTHKRLADVQPIMIG
jgi:DNA modification methylase